MDTLQNSIENETKDIPHAICFDQLKPADCRREKFGNEAVICAFSPDESCLAWSCGNRQVVIIPWDKKQLRLKKTNDRLDWNQSSIVVDNNYSVWALAFGSTEIQREKNRWTHLKFCCSLILATGLSNGRIRIWDVATGKLLNEVMDHRGIVAHLSFAPDGSLRLVSASNDTTLKIWELMDEGNLVATLNGHPKWVSACAWSSDSRMLASVGGGKSVFLWDMTKYKLLSRLSGHLHDVVSCDFSPDGALLATASWDTRIFLWDVYFGHVVRSFGHLHPPPRPIFASGANGKWIRSVAFSPFGTHIASVADDGLVRIWNIFDESTPETVGVVNDAICCCFTPSGSVLAIGQKQGIVSLWSVPARVSSLQHLCRLVLNQHVKWSSLTRLKMPSRIQTYLRYEL